MYRFRCGYQWIPKKPSLLRVLVAYIKPHHCHNKMYSSAHEFPTSTSVYYYMFVYVCACVGVFVCLCNIEGDGGVYKCDVVLVLDWVSLPGGCVAGLQYVVSHIDTLLYNINTRRKLRETWYIRTQYTLFYASKHKISNSKLKAMS